ncbi:MAG: apolipoprotein N-acyltransferase [Burkholderiales bacterium]
MAISSAPVISSRPGIALCSAFALGALTVAGFAPFSLFALPILTLALLMHLWQIQATPRRAAAVGFAFGLGLFLAGVSWVYVSLHDFGAMPAALAALATLLFCAYLALFPALTGYCFAKTRWRGWAGPVLFVPALWTLLEWVRGWLFTGFPWLAIGYSQVPASPLAGYAPVLGLYGVSLATAASAGLLVASWRPLASCFRNEGAGTKAQGKPAHPRFLHPGALALAVLGFGGWGLKQIEWTQPVGAPVEISLLQGNIPQDLKWREDHIRATLDGYRRMVEASTSRLIILPETALPLFVHDVPPGYLQQLAAHARKNNGDVLIGVPERLAGGDYYNSVLSFGTAATQSYRKSHLVPFGEYIPLRPLLGGIVAVLAIPLQDFSRGAQTQQPLAVAGQSVAINICYEDAFGEEIIRQVPQATLLVNVSNVAWFGRSIAPRQHLQISQTRALETGRYMLRATNTGVTAVIDHRGRVARSAPEFTTATVTHPVQGYRGETPYVRRGNYGVLGLLAVMLIAGAFVKKSR